MTRDVGRMIWTADEEGARVLVRIVMQWPSNWGKPTYIRLQRQCGMTNSTFYRALLEAVKRWLTGGGKGGYRLNPDGTWKEALADAPGMEASGSEGSSKLPSDEEVMALSHDLAELLKKV
jgi:hypothetical protein